MKILLFGGSGQLGCELIPRAKELSFEVISPVLSEISITDEKQVEHLIKMISPEVIINAAAYTAVDHAEEEQEEAFLTNRDGPGYIAVAAQEIGVRLIHLSTDYVFPGTGTTAYTEDSPLSPVNVYGASKLAGEKVIQEIMGERAVILRTSSLHGKYGQNFVHTMLDLFESKKEVSVVDDQVMSPTWAGWLSEVLLDICRLNVGGVFHACSSGEVSWYEFARSILEMSTRLDDEHEAVIKPVSTEHYPRPAKRPAYSVLNCSKLTELIGRAPITWQEGLRSHLHDLERLKE